MATKHRKRFKHLPIDFLNACVSASVFDISREKISEPASMVNGVSSPRLLAIPMAMAVLPVPGWPPIRMALPAIFYSLIICKITPAALLASTCIQKKRDWLTNCCRNIFRKLTLSSEWCLLHHRFPRILLNWECKEDSVENCWTRENGSRVWMMSAFIKHFTATPPKLSTDHQKAWRSKLDGFKFELFLQELPWWFVQWHWMSEQYFDTRLTSQIFKIAHAILTCPTIPCEIFLGSRLSSRPSPLIWLCAPILSIRVMSLTS